MLKENAADFLAHGLPFWQALTESERQGILENTTVHTYDKDSLHFHSAVECAGLIVVKSGQLRAFITSDEGKEISLYRLLPLDICIMSASCMLKNLNFNISLQVEKESELLVIPTAIFEQIHDQNTDVKNFTLELVTARFSDVMWVLEQLVFSNMGKRLAATLLEQSALAGSAMVEITHEDIAKELGTAREVVTRLLKQFQLEHMVALSRSKIEIIDMDKLRKFSE